MADPTKQVTKDGKITAKSDKEGVSVFICAPNWFDGRTTYKVANAPARTAALEFNGDDLNFIARVLYAEASGSAQLTDNAERSKEKEAILNVKHFRLNRAGYPGRAKALSFRQVCEAPGQFESVYAASTKFTSSDSSQSSSLKKAECNDLEEALKAIRDFLASGPNKNYIYDNFRGGKGSRGKTIGRSRFFLSSEGEKLHEKEE